MYASFVDEKSSDEESEYEDYAMVRNVGTKSRPKKVVNDEFDSEGSEVIIQSSIAFSVSEYPSHIMSVFTLVFKVLTFMINLPCIFCLICIKNLDSSTFERVYGMKI